MKLDSNFKNVDGYSFYQGSHSGGLEIVSAAANTKGIHILKGCCNASSNYLAIQLSGPAYEKTICFAYGSMNSEIENYFVPAGTPLYIEGTSTNGYVLIIYKVL